MKLTIMTRCRTRFRRVKRWNCAPALSASIGVSHRCGGQGGTGRRPPALPAHLERPRDPQERVQAADAERADEQRRHPPEGPVEERVLVRIVMGGVGEIPGEPPRGALVALL